MGVVKVHRVKRSMFTCEGSGDELKFKIYFPDRHSGRF